MKSKTENNNRNTVYNSCCRFLLCPPQYAGYAREAGINVPGAAARIWLITLIQVYGTIMRIITIKALKTAPIPPEFQ